MRTIQTSLLVSFVCGWLIFLPQAQAANRVWSGTGADANWATAGNWGGTAPVNNDTVTFSGTTQQNNTNNISSLTVGWMTLANGGFTLNGTSGNLLALNGALTNSAGTSTLALGVNVTAGNLGWNIAAGSELDFTGLLTNAGSANALAIMGGGGVLRIKSASFQPNRFFTLTNGTIIIDGGVVSTIDGFRLEPPTGATAVFQLTNNGSLTIGVGGNLRLGFTTTGGSSRVDMYSGTLNLDITSGLGAGDLYVGEAASTTTVFNQNGGLVEFAGNGDNRVAFANSSASANGTYNLNGGTLWTASIVQINAGSPGGTFNFNGGTLKPLVNSTTFFQGVQAANIMAGGAIIDTTNLNITIAESLPGAGGLTKLGSGTLTLTGNNGYSGPTAVSNGTLNVIGNDSGSGAVTVGASGILSGSGIVAGAVSVQAGGTLSPGGVSGTPTIITLQSNLTLAGNVAIQVNKSLSVTNDLITVSGTLTNSGTGTLTLANSGAAFTIGDSFKVFSKALANGGSISLLPNPPGTGLVWTNGLAVNGTVGVASATNANAAANLTSLVLSVGTLSPAFNTNVVNYTATVAYTNSSVIITPTSLNAGSTIQIITAKSTNSVASGSPSAPIALNPNTNLIDVRVIAPGGSAVKDYYVMLTRTPPNVILILADDQGFSDWSCYGSEIPTPNLDSLAATGLRFRNFHNAARCSPTRCSILTGLYTQQAAVDPSASLPTMRTDNNVTIAELLGANGYHTYMAGKWHLGSGTGQAPEQRGFDEVFTYINGTADHEDCWDPTQYRFASTDGETTNINYAAGTFYQPDAIGDYCLQFLNNQFARHTNAPFFMYIPFGSAHFLIQAPQAMADTNALTYAAGWDYIRNQRYTNMLAQGVIDSRYALSPNEGTAPWSAVPAEVIPAWNTLDTNRQADLTRRMAIYAAMIQKMDANIGRVVQYLQQNGQLDNTLIIAVSDNGGNYEGGVYGLTGSTSDAAPVTGTNLENMGLSGQPAIYVGGGWAHVSNTPFRWFKHFDHFGGIGTPCIAHWPQGLTRSNQWENEQGHIMDVMSTIVDATGVSYPTNWTNSVIGTNYSVLPLQGISLKPWFTSNLTDTSRNVGFEHEGNRAYISNNWNLVTKNFTSVDGSYFANELELYDLNHDPSQVTNLAYTNLTVLAQMVTNWNNWCTYVGDASSLLIPSSSNPAPTLQLDPAQTTNDLFVDTFDRADSTNAQASTTGMWGNYVPPLGAGTAYYEGYDSQYLQIYSNTLYKAPGGMVESGIIYNFTGSDIVAAGGFSVELNVVTINSSTSDSTNRYAGFGVGLTQAQAASGSDIYNPLSPGQVTFRGAIGGNTGISPFFADLNLNGAIEVWTNGVLVNTISVGATSGILTASFACAGFNTTNPVVANVFFNGQLVNINPFGTNSTGITFYWSTNGNNYVGLSMRASNFSQVDNLAIRKLPLTDGLATDYAMSYGLSGAAAAPNADPDGDGVSNFGEWAFGGSPVAPDAYIAGFQGIQVLPGNDFRFEFQRYRNYAAVGLHYHFLTSPDLKNWTEITPNVLAANVNEDKTAYEVVTMELPASATTNQTKLFLRILASVGN